MSSFPDEQYNQPFWMRHKGPFRLVATRPHTGRGKKGQWTSEWLKGSVDGPDVEDESKALLTDPRDSITSIHVWDESEQMFVYGYKQEVASEK